MTDTKQNNIYYPSLNIENQSSPLYNSVISQQYPSAPPADDFNDSTVNSSIQYTALKYKIQNFNTNYGIRNKIWNFLKVLTCILLLTCIGYLLSRKINGLEKVINAFISPEFTEYLRNHKGILIFLMMFFIVKLINKICSLFSKTNQTISTNGFSSKQELAKQWLSDFSRGLGKDLEKRYVHILFNLYCMSNNYNTCNKYGISSTFRTFINLIIRRKSSESDEDFTIRRDDAEVIPLGISSLADYFIKKNSNYCWNSSSQYWST